MTTADDDTSGVGGHLVQSGPPLEDPASSPHRLSIGDLAERTGLTTSALRMWEQRYGFPVPHRLPGGHRRYTPYDVEMVNEILRRREAGVRLEQAVADARLSSAPPSPSVFAALRERHPHLEVHRMHKSTLLAMSWAIEDQVGALGDGAMLWATFQAERFYRPSSARWRDLAATGCGVTVYADFDRSDPTAVPRRVGLPSEAPLNREWVVVVDSPHFPMALSAWELPGQEGLADRSRMFETMWTLEPTAVRDAARVCAGVARTVDEHFDRGRFVVPPPLDPSWRPAPSPERLMNLFARMASYVDRFTPVMQQVRIPPLAAVPDRPGSVG